MAKMTKVFGAIFCVLGTVYLIVSTFLYLNTSAHLDYNTGKLMTLPASGVLYYFMISIIILAFGILFAKDRIIDNDKH